MYFNSEVELCVTGVAFGGFGIGRVDNFVIFVPKAITGDIVRVRIYETKKRYAKGSILEIIKASSIRKEPECKYFDECGGCHFQNIDYNSELDIKLKCFLETLCKLTKDSTIKISKSYVSPRYLNYRNKITLHSDGTKLGYFNYLSDKIVDILECKIAEDPINRKLNEIRSSLMSVTLNPIWGECQGVLKLSSQKTNIRATQSLKCGNSKFSELVLRAAKDKCITYFKSSEENKILRNIDQDDLIFEDRIGEYKYLQSPETFFQVNRDVAWEMIDLILKLCNFSGKTVLDLYCGTGFFSIPIAKRAIRVLGIESDVKSVALAQKNSILNGVDNCEFISGRVGESLAKLTNQLKNFDVAIIDPPRFGCHESIPKYLTGLSVNRIFYISCNPATLARDILRFRKEGYELRDIILFDMFPRTYHIESLCVMERVE